MAEVKTIQLNENIYANNEEQAEITRKMLTDKGI